MSDALFGVDGTQMPESFSAPSKRSRAHASVLPPFALPPLPDSSIFREAMAAALDGDVSRLLDQDSSRQSPTPQAPTSPSPTPQPSPQPGAAAAPAPPPSTPQVNTPPPGVPSPTVPSHPVTAPLPTQAAPQAGRRPPPAPPRPIRRAVQPPAPAPAQPLPGKLDRSPYRPPVARGFRRAAQLGDLRRRVSSTALPVATRSNGGAGVFFVVAAAIFVVLAYEIIVGIVEAIARLIP